MRKGSHHKIRLGEKYYVQEWALDGYVEIVRRQGLAYGELERDPYNFDDTVVKKILHLQVNYGPGPEHYRLPVSSAANAHQRCTGYQPNHGVVEAAVKELLSVELSRASYVMDDHSSLN